MTAGQPSCPVDLESGAAGRATSKLLHTCVFPIVATRVKITDVKL